MTLLETWGEKLTGIAFLYSFIAMIIVYSYAASGLQPPPVLPTPIIQVYERAYNTWSSISGVLLSGNALQIAGTLLTNIGALFSTIVAFMASTVLAYAWLAVIVTQYLPPPLTILAVPVWVGAFFANLVVMMYLIRKAMELLEKIAGYVSPA